VSSSKARFFEALWKVWNWPDVAERFAAAGQVQLELAGAVASRRK
jgi:hypothetical protein